MGRFNKKLLPECVRNSRVFVRNQRVIYGRKITQALLLCRFTYDNGRLLHRKCGIFKYIGKPAGVIGARNGYTQITINGKIYNEHRLVWLMLNGIMPRMLDHINKIPTDNRIENLRVCSHSQNNMNWHSRPHTSNYKGVCYVTRSGSIRAQIQKDGEVHYLGVFPTERDAAKAYNEKALELFGEFAVLNIIEGEDDGSHINSEIKTNTNKG